MAGDFLKILNLEMLLMFLQTMGIQEDIQMHLERLKELSRLKKVEGGLHGMAYGLSKTRMNFILVLVEALIILALFIHGVEI
jgi:hypothetical protein